MRSIEFTIKDLGKYKINIDPYSIFSDMEKKLEINEGNILKKLIPVSHHEVLSPDYLDKPKYFFLRTLISDFVYLYKILNLGDIQDINSILEELNSLQDSKLEDIIFLENQEEIS